MSNTAADIKNGNIKNVYLFYGEEAFKKRHFKELLLSCVVKGNTMNYSAFEGKDIDWQAVLDATQTLPFFADRRLVVVENSGIFQAKKSETEEKSSAKNSKGSMQERILEELPETTCLAFFEESAAKNKRIYKMIAAKGIAEECSADTQEELVNWLARGFAGAGKKVRKSTLELLVGRIGLSYDQLRNEFEKLVSYTDGKDVIEDQDILDITSENIESKIFDLLTAMCEKQTHRVLQKYNDLLANREHPLYIMAMLRGQLRIMLQTAELSDKGLSAAEIAKAVGRPTFAINNMKRYLRSFSKNQLVQMLDNISDVDRRCKSGEIQDQIGVEMLLISFSS